MLVNIVKPSRARQARPMFAQSLINAAMRRLAAFLQRRARARERERGQGREEEAGREGEREAGRGKERESEHERGEGASKKKNGGRGQLVGARKIQRKDDIRVWRQNNTNKSRQQVTN